jgi:hypothetical protein
MKRTMPKGYRPKKGDPRPRVAVIFDDELFEKICARAKQERKGFGEMVRELCKVGLFDLEESDRFEPAA